MTASQWEEFAPRFTNRSTEALARLQTSAAEDATPEATDESRSVVLLMPGWGAPAASTTVLAEELASHGHVVVTIGPPEGSEPLDASDDATFAAGARARVAAVSATLEKLNDPKVAELVGSIDADRVAAGGMSFGGPVGFAASLDEPSVAAVFDLDGSLDVIPSMKPVVVPALMIVTPTEDRFDAGYTTTQLLADSKDVVSVGIRRAGHCDLNDLTLILLATETDPSDFAAGAECFGEIGTEGPTTTAVIVQRFLDDALDTPAALPAGEHLIEGLSDGVPDPIGLGR